MKNLITAAIAAGMAFAAAPAHAAYVINFTEVGSTVVMTGSGSFDLTALTYAGTGPVSNATVVGPNTGYFQMAGPTNPQRNVVDLYTGISGPATFGFRAATSAVSSVLEYALFFRGSGANPVIGTPEDYVSGTVLGTNAATFNGSFDSLGLTVGTYNWTWGGGSTADSFTINIGAAVPPGAIPEPATWAMLILGFGAVGGALRQRNRKRPALQYC